MDEDQFLIGQLIAARNEFDALMAQAAIARVKMREAAITALEAEIEVGRVVEASGYSYETVRVLARRASIPPRNSGPRSTK